MAKYIKFGSINVVEWSPLKSKDLDPNAVFTVCDDWLDKVGIDHIYYDDVVALRDALSAAIDAAKEACGIE